MGKIYCCPDYHGTEVIWDMRTAKAICPKDCKPISEYQLMDQGGLFSTWNKKQNLKRTEDKAFELSVTS